MSIEKRLLQEAESEARKDKIKKIWQKHKNLIIFITVIVIVLITVITSSNIYKKEKQKKYSALIQQVFVYEQEGDSDMAKSELKKLYEDNSVPEGIKSLVSLKYATSLLREGNIEEATRIYLEINKNHRYDSFVREFAGLSALKALIDSNNDDYKQKIINLTASLEKDSHILTYFIIEQKAVFEWSNKNFKIANDIFESLINNPEVPSTIKNRAEKMNKIYITNK